MLGAAEGPRVFCVVVPFKVYGCKRRFVSLTYGTEFNIVFQVSSFPAMCSSQMALVLRSTVLCNAIIYRRTFDSWISNMIFYRRNLLSFQLDFNSITYRFLSIYKVFPIMLNILLIFSNVLYYTLYEQMDVPNGIHNVHTLLWFCCDLYGSWLHI